MIDYNAYTIDERRAFVAMARIGLSEPVPLDDSSEEAFARTFVQRYYFRPDLFFKEMLGVEPDEWQEDLSFDVAAGEPRIAVRSCHRPGKSTGAGGIAIWFLMTRFRVKVSMTAPTAPQAFDALFAETKSLFSRLPAQIQRVYEVKSDEIHMKDLRDQLLSQDIKLVVRTASKEKPESIQGKHSDNVLFICDEASAVDDAVFVAAGSSMAGAEGRVTELLLGNPTRLTGRFARIFKKKEMRDLYIRYHVGYQVAKSVDDDGTRHYPSMRTSKQYADGIAAEFGEDSNEYRVRVKGDFGDLDSDSYIPASLVSAAMLRDIAVPNGKRPVWALDPARYGPDKSALAERRGPVITWVKTKHGLDTMALAGWVKAMYDELPEQDKPTQIFIDVIGIGSGTYDRLHELGLPVVAVNVSESPIDPLSKSVRLRDELWKRFLTWLRSLVCRIVEDELLLEDLTKLGYTHTSDGRLKIQSKEELRTKGISSPDRADAVVMTMLAEDYQTFAAPGYAKSSGGALERNLRCTV